MIIINADDWGRSRDETDVALTCYKAGRITSVSAMVYMEDSERAADIALSTGIDVGLHLNLSQRFTGVCCDRTLLANHERIVRFLTKSKYSVLFYNPTLRKQFRQVFQAQIAEFHRLYGKTPTHIDGHQHMHLCVNMVLDRIFPSGMKMRRNFTFCPGEKSFLNRIYRQLVDFQLTRSYRLTDYFFSLSHCLQEDKLLLVAELAGGAIVEIMAHPAKANEYDYLMSDDYLTILSKLEIGTYSLL